MPSFVVSASSPLRPSSIRTRRRKLLAVTSLGLAGLVAGLLSGCSGATQVLSSGVPSAEGFAGVTGNWRFVSSGSVELAGALAVAGSHVSGHLHTVAGSCGSSEGAAFAVSGTIDAEGRLRLSGQDDAERGFAVSGIVGADQRSLVDPNVSMTGSCPINVVAHAVHAEDNAGTTGQQYQAVTGSYTGSFTDTDGDSLPVQATLSQPTSPDANGIYHLTGRATFAGVTCLSSPIVTSSTVTGNQISATYTDPNSGASVTGSGTFSPDAQTLTIDTWTLTGSCGPANGFGTLAHQ